VFAQANPGNKEASLTRCLISMQRQPISLSKKRASISHDNGENHSLVTSSPGGPLPMFNSTLLRSAKAPVEHFTRAARQGIFHPVCPFGDSHRTRPRWNKHLLLWSGNTWSGWHFH